MIRFATKFTIKVHKELLAMGFYNRVSESDTGLMYGFTYDRLINSKIESIRYDYEYPNTIFFDINEESIRFIHIGAKGDEYESLLFKALRNSFPQVKNYTPEALCEVKSLEPIDNWIKISEMHYQKSVGFNMLKIKYNTGKKKFELYANESYITDADNELLLKSFAKDNYNAI